MELGVEPGKIPEVKLDVYIDKKRNPEIINLENGIENNNNSNNNVNSGNGNSQSTSNFNQSSRTVPQNSTAQNNAPVKKRKRE
jgi:hypothetical protein